MIIIKRKILKILLVILIIIGIILFLNIPEKIQKIIYKTQYEYYVEKYASEYNVDKNLIYAVIKVESNFKNTAKSNKEAIGLMQLMESTAKDVCEKMEINITDAELKKELLNPDMNINIGTKYLSTLIEKYQNIEVAVAAYNAGSGTVDNWIKDGIIKADGSDIENIPYKETNNYVRKILRDYKIYSKLN